jgi:tRNA threonylcarbamoyladenosine biosynthesis protein TsaE
MDFFSRSPEETKKIAADFARTLHGGELVSLCGELGSGKTSFVKGIAKALGVEEEVRSPTFTLMQVFETRHPCVIYVVHVDAYRLRRPDELKELGLQEWFGRTDTAIFIEWPERLEGVLPTPTRTVRFSHGSYPSERCLEI